MSSSPSHSTYWWQSDINQQSGIPPSQNVDQNNWGQVEVTFAALVLVLILLIFGYRIYMDRSRRNANHPSASRLSPQEQLEAAKKAKIAERRDWYQLYLKPFTMTAATEDFFYSKEFDTHVVAPPQPVVKDQSKMWNRKRTDTLSSCDDDDDDDYDLDEDYNALGEEWGLKGIDSTTKTTTMVLIGDNSCGSVEQCEDDEANEQASHLYIRLPVSNNHGNNGGTRARTTTTTTTTTTKSTNRAVDAECAVCFCTYEEGDLIVWSGLKCRHAFHHDCILPWLEKGKKRCPICRHLFVPGGRIEDQRKEYEAARQQELQQQQQQQQVPQAEIPSTNDDEFESEYFVDLEAPLASSNVEALEASNNSTESPGSDSRFVAMESTAQEQQQQQQQQQQVLHTEIPSTSTEEEEVDPKTLDLEAQLSSSNALDMEASNSSKSPEPEQSGTVNFESTQSKDGEVGSPKTRSIDETSE